MLKFLKRQNRGPLTVTAEEYVESILNNRLCTKQDVAIAFNDDAAEAMQARGYKGQEDDYDYVMRMLLLHHVVNARQHIEVSTVLFHACHYYNEKPTELLALLIIECLEELDSNCSREFAGEHVLSVDCKWQLYDCNRVYIELLGTIGTKEAVERLINRPTNGANEYELKLNSIARSGQEAGLTFIEKQIPHFEDAKPNAMNPEAIKALGYCTNEGAVDVLVKILTTEYQSTFVEDADSNATWQTAAEALLELAKRFDSAETELKRLIRNPEQSEDYKGLQILIRSLPNEAKVVGWLQDAIRAIEKAQVHHQVMRLKALIEKLHKIEGETGLKFVEEEFNGAPFCNNFLKDAVNTQLHDLRSIS